MARDVMLPASLALNRFGLGARPGDLERVGGDVRGFLRQEVERRAAPQPTGPGLLDTAGAFSALREQNERVRLASAARPDPAAPVPGTAPQMAGPAMEGAPT